MRASFNCRLFRILGFSLAAWVAFAAPTAAQMIPTFTYGDGRIADARLGFAASLIVDFADAPPALASPQVRRFAEDAFARLVADAPDVDLRAQLSGEQAAFDAAGDNPHFDPRAYAATVRKTMAAYVRGLDPARAQAFVIGGLADQIAYNARVLRESDRDRFFRDALSGADDLDALVPGLGDLRASVAAVPDGQWTAIAATDDRFTAALLNTSPVLLGYGQPASSTSVWTILVRLRTIDDYGPRKGTVHASIDIVYADSTHKTIGAYPNGKYDFTKDGGPLLCGAGLEPDGGTSTVVPLVPPKNGSYDELALRLLDGCTAFNQRNFTYDALGQTGANDNTFVAGILAFNGIDTAGIFPSPEPNAVPVAAPSPQISPSPQPSPSPQASP